MERDFARFRPSGDIPQEALEEYGPGTVLMDN